MSQIPASGSCSKKLPPTEMGLHNGEGEKRGGGLLSCNISPLRPPPLANLVGASERAEAAVASGLLCDASAGRGERPPANRDRPTNYPRERKSDWLHRGSERQGATRPPSPSPAARPPLFLCRHRPRSLSLWGSLTRFILLSPPLPSLSSLLHQKFDPLAQKGTLTLYPQSSRLPS